jgi:hypothetical protein
MTSNAGLRLSSSWVEVLGRPDRGIEGSRQRRRYRSGNQEGRGRVVSRSAVRAEMTGVGHGHAAGLGAAYFPFRRATLVEERPLRTVPAAFFRATAGSTATASISNKAPSRARPEIVMVVLAGRFASAR